MPCCSSMSSRSESVPRLMPAHACSSCMNRRGPSERSWTISGVQFVAITSALAATAQPLQSWTSFMVLFMRGSLLGPAARSYRNGSVEEPRTHEPGSAGPNQVHGCPPVGGKVQVPCPRHYFTKYSYAMVIVKSRSFRPWSKAGGRWTHELVAYGLDLYHRRHLRTPTVRELRAGVDGLPSHATIRRLYGNASTMLRVHGYRVRR